jgi:branched-chain amino acid transport system permease protein
MAFAVFMDYMVFPNNAVFGNFGALDVGRLDILGLSFNSERAYFVLLAIAFALFGIVVLRIRRGTFGRVLSAMRDSPVACATLGLSLTRTKLMVFMLAAAMAGVAGALFGGLKGSAGQTDFLMLQSLPLLLLAVIGGITSVSGALLGGLFFALPAIFENETAQKLQFLWVGIAAVSIGRNPNGIAFSISERLRRLFGIMASRPEPIPRPAAPPQTQEQEEEVPEVAASAG